jgi:hypothetical protein
MTKSVASLFQVPESQVPETKGQDTQTPRLATMVLVTAGAPILSTDHVRHVRGDFVKNRDCAVVADVIRLTPDQM